jgi:N,N'-diacetylbacillosaminyl-diphospho-undecaprenol alpha-1,3-N-acetylgalactosaminyltransferase
MGKAIVTTDTVGCREVVINNINGFLVPVKDSKTLADKIEQLYIDSELRERFGSNSRVKAVREFDVEVVVNQYIKIYESLIS